VEYTPKEELDGRVVRIQAVMLEKGLDASFIIQKADLFYFSGTIQSSVLCIPAEGSPVLLARKSYERACKESGIVNIVSLNSYKDLPNLLKDHKITNLDNVGMEFDIIPSSLLISFQNIFPKTSFIDISKAIRNLRMIKSAYEIDLMRKSGKICDEILEEAKNELRAGRTEVEIASHILNIAYRKGSHGPCAIRDWNQGAFNLPIVLSGENGAVATYTDGPIGGKGVSCFVPIGPSNKTIEAHEPIIIDIGAGYNGYSVDVTRTFSLGKPALSMSDAYEATLKIQEQIIRELVPGKKCSDLYRIAEEMAGSLGYLDNFMGYGKDRVRFIGHGVGMEMNELPVFAMGFDTPIEQGMTVAIEPKLVFPGLGAVGIENTWLVGKSRAEPLTVVDEALCII